MDMDKVLRALGFTTQHELATAYGVHLSAVTHWKRRGIGDAVKRRLERLAAERGVDKAELELDA